MTADAVVFDMDGVIVDSEHQWRLGEAGLFQEVVPAWKDDDHHHIVGLGVVELHQWLVERYGVTETRESFLKRCDDLARLIYREKVTQAPGFSEFLAKVRDGKTPVGLASSSPRRWIDLVLSRFSLENAFDAVVSGDETGGRNKPLPDIYLIAASRLGRDPRRCLAIEDSRLGVAAAKAAGLTCAAYRSGTNDEQDLSAADFEFRAFGQLDPERLLARPPAA